MDIDAMDTALADWSVRNNSLASTGSTGASSNTATPAFSQSSQNTKHKCRLVQGFQGCLDAGCKARCEAVMRDFRERLFAKQLTPQDMDNTMLQVLKDHRGWWYQISRFFAQTEVEYFVRSTGEEFNTAVAKRMQAVEQTVPQGSDTSVAGPSTSTTWSMQLPLGKDLAANKDWAISRTERDHFEFIVNAIKRRGVTTPEFRKKVEQMAIERAEMDKAGIPTYVMTMYQNFQSRVVKDMKLLDCKNLLPCGFDPRRVDPATKNLIELWLKGWSARDPWKQQVMYNRRTQLVNSPKLGLWNVVGSFRTTATMEILGQSVNQRPASSCTSDAALKPGKQSMKQLTRYVLHHNKEARAIAKKAAVQAKEQAAKRASDKTTRIRAEDSQTRVISEQRAKDLATRVRKEEIEAEAAAEQKRYEESWGDYFTKLNQLCQRKVGNQEYKTKISAEKLWDLQQGFPDGGIMDVGGQWIRIPGVTEMEVDA